MEADREAIVAGQLSVCGLTEKNEWKWWTIEIARHENTGHENDGPKMMAGREMAGEKIQC